MHGLSRDKCNHLFGYALFWPVDSCPYDGVLFFCVSDPGVFFLNGPSIHTVEIFRLSELAVDSV